MIIQATSHGTAAKEEPFAFTYSGDFTDERVDGIGDVTLNTSGVFEVLSGKVTVSVYILGAGGGAARVTWKSTPKTARGGGGGEQTITMNLMPGVYEIFIGVGGTFVTGSATTSNVSKTGEDGGNTEAFGTVSTGGKGAFVSYGPSSTVQTPGAGGTPNGVAGGGNGGDVSAGGDGLVRITFS